MTTYRVRVAIALLLGVGSITAGLLTWRAGQIGSSAAFEDRRAVGQEVASAQRRIEVTTDLAAAGAEYTRYLADQVEADAADAKALAVVGSDADLVTPYGESLRRGAAVRAEVLDLFLADPEARLRAVHEKLRELGAQRVLDLGCGEGKLLRRLL